MSSELVDELSIDLSLIGCGHSRAALEGTSVDVEGAAGYLNGGALGGAYGRAGLASFGAYGKSTGGGPIDGGELRADAAAGDGEAAVAGFDIVGAQGKGGTVDVAAGDADLGAGAGAVIIAGEDIDRCGHAAAGALHGAAGDVENAAVSHDAVVAVAIYSARGVDRAAEVDDDIGALVDIAAAVEVCGGLNGENSAFGVDYAVDGLLDRRGYAEIAVPDRQVALVEYGCASA